MSRSERATVKPRPSANPVTADATSKLVVYQYALGHTGFNSGPKPCTGLTNYTYRLDTTGPFLTGAGYQTCNTSVWYPSATHGTGQYLTLLHNTAQGVYWGTGMGGPDGWGHDAWWYVR